MAEEEEVEEKVGSGRDDQLLVKVSIRLPSDDFIDLTVLPDTSISDILASISAQEIGLKPSHLTLLHRKQPMAPVCLLSEYNVEGNSSVALEALLSSVDDMDLRYDEFIEEMKLSTVDQSLSGVSVEAYFTIRFRANTTGLALFLPALEDSGCIHCLDNDTQGTRMVEVLGEEEAGKRGFRQWGGGVLQSRVHLLEITDPTLEFDSSQCRYDSASPLNAGYSQGDGASWQRYTLTPPRPCMLHVDPLEGIVRLIPQDPLESEACYALLLQNGVPCPPDSELEGPLLGFTHCAGVREDKLIFFSTEAGAAGYGMY